MHVVKEKTKKLCELQEKLICAINTYMAEGIEKVNTHEAGQVIDMIKDLSEAEEKLWKACYYRTVTEAMKEAEEAGLMSIDRMGYDNWRYSSGRFAPKGRGHYKVRRGYVPMDYPMDIDGDYPMEVGFPPYRMGYDGDYPMMFGQEPDDAMYRSQSTSLDHFRKAKRNYTETHDSKDLAEMTKYGKHHIDETVDTMREMWEDADPELRDKMKKSIAGLINEFK